MEFLESGLAVLGFLVAAAAARWPHEKPDPPPESIRKQLSLLEQILEGTGEACLAVDLTGRFLFYNSVAEKLMGPNQGEIPPSQWPVVFGVCRVDGKTPFAVEELPLVRAMGGEYIDNQELCLKRESGLLFLRVRAYPLHDESGELAGAVIVATDFTQERTAQLRLTESEQRFRLAFSYALTGMALVGVDGKWLRVNRSLCRIVGYSEEELLRLDFQSITHPDDLADDLRQVRMMLRGEIDHYSMEKRYIHKQGHPVWVQLGVVLLLDSEGQPLYFMAEIQDIHSRKLAEENLIRNENRFRGIFNQTFQFCGLLSPDGTLLEANKTALDYGGLDRSEVVGKPFWETYWWTTSQETQERIRSAVEAAARGEFIRFEADVRGREDTVVPVDFSLKPLLDEEGNVTLLIPEGRDIAEQKRTQLELQRSLEEKEVLLKEIHHRVKNNFQIVLGLLQLQAASADNPVLERMLHDSENRIRSMVMVHEQIYRSKDLARVDFAEYLRNLTDGLAASYGGSLDQVEVEFIAAAKCLLELEQAVPCGLFANEALSNAFQHAFPPSTPGRIEVRLEPSEQQVSLSILDNGKGLPPGMDPANCETLGFQLLTELARQLNGSVEIRGSGGTAVRLNFPVRRALDE